MSNNTYEYAPAYDPDAPKPMHHWQMELSTICIVNSLTLITLVGRTCYRWTKLKRFRKEDGWIVGAAIVLVGLFVCQVGASMTGSGLRIYNVPNSWLEPHWIFSWGWIGYYLSISMIKVSICCCLLEFIPYHFKMMRRLIIALCFFIMALSLAESFTWLFQCQPFTSNFAWNVLQTSCIDIDYPRYIWSGLSIPIDIAILSVPFEVVKRTGLQNHEKQVLMFVFGANLLGTIACGIGIYGTWENRQSLGEDVYYSETVFIMINDIEIFCYALGASFPIFSRYFIAKSAPSQRSPSQVTRPSWIRTVTTSLNHTFVNASSNAPTFTNRPKTNSTGRRSTQPNLLPISEIHSTNISNRSQSPVSDFITVLQSLNESNDTGSESEKRMVDLEMGLASHSSSDMSVMGDEEKDVVPPLHIHTRHVARSPSPSSEYSQGTL